MSQYGVLLNGFWEGETGRAIAAAGGTTAQVVAVYLMQNPDANMIGLYPARLIVIQERIATITAEGLTEALGLLGRVGFAYYDLLSEYVWVKEMAKFRLQLDRTGALHKDDKRVIGAQKLYAAARPNPFLDRFFTRYRRDLHLPKRRTFKGPSKVLGSPFPRGFEAPSKPGDQGTEITEQDQKSDQDQKMQRAVARPSLTLDDVRTNLEAATWKLLKSGPPYVDAKGRISISELVAELKHIAARLFGVEWELGHEITAIVNAVLAQYDKRRRSA